ncbi:MAG: hypothetical protein DYG98_00995 [Haliscomenobacteraceae bacterium CHB4]|nr:hypothetical protein [Haliscomenobacteraceae bacterium CHB4]
MKKLILLCLALSGAIYATNAQTPAAADEKYTAAFKKALLNLDSSWANPPRMRETANQFERLANYKKTEWLPRYYHALCLIQYSWSADAKERETILKSAETSIQTGMALTPDSSEMIALEGYLYQAMIMINPMANGAVYGPKSGMTLQRAALLNPSNPRPPYLLGQNIYFTPEMWGGGMEKARPHLEKAKALFATFKPASALHPNWGQVPCDMILEGKMKKE